MFMHLAQPPSGLAWWLHAEPTQQMSMHVVSSQRHPSASASPSLHARCCFGGGVANTQADLPPGCAGWAQPASAPQQVSKHAPPLRHSQPVSSRSPASHARGAAGSDFASTGLCAGAGGGASFTRASLAGAAGCASLGAAAGSGVRVHAPASAMTSATARRRMRLSDRSGVVKDPRIAAEDRRSPAA